MHVKFSDICWPPPPPQPTLKCLITTNCRCITQYIFNFFVVFFFDFVTMPSIYVNTCISVTVNFLFVTFSDYNANRVSFLNKNFCCFHFIIGRGGLKKWPSSVRVCVILSVRPSFRPRDLVSATPPTSFIGFTWNFVGFLPMIWRCACGFRILIRLFLTELSPMLTKLCKTWSCLHSSSYIFHWIHLKYCRLSSYDMKMCMWFRIFDWTIFDGVISHADICFVGLKNLVSSTPSTSFIGFIWNFVDCLPMTQRCAYFSILIWLFLLELLPMLT